MPFIDPPAQTVMYAALSTETPLAVEQSVRAAMANYAQQYGHFRHVWINPKDCPADLLTVDGVPLERKGGCPRNKVMVL